MSKSLRIAALVSLMLAVAGVSQSFAAGEVSDITVTPDGRRVAIKSESRMGSYTEQVVTNPSRLVIDIAETGMSQLPRISGLARDSSLNIRTAKTASGARVVLDFGSQPVPDHKIVKMSNYLLVFLGQGSVQEDGQPRPRPERVKPKETASAPTAPSVRAQRPKRLPAAAAPNASDLSIQSAEIIDGLIVLKVASKTNPAMVYRVDLGVDFGQMGFSTARIAPVQEIARSSETASGASGVRGAKMGPRRLQTNLMAVSTAGIQEESIASADE
jgi:hypothetical protein